MYVIYTHDGTGEENFTQESHKLPSSSSPIPLFLSSPYETKIHALVCSRLYLMNLTAMPLVVLVFLIISYATSPNAAVSHWLSPLY